MSRLIWDDPSTRPFTTGVNRGVIYPRNGIPQVWNGLVSVSAKPSGGDNVKRYFDGYPYLNQKVVEDSFSGSIEAFTYPAVLDDLDVFDFTYQTLGDDDKYKIHLVYNAMLRPVEVDRSSVSDGVNLTTLAWDFVTIPIVIPGARASSHLVVDPEIAYSWALTDLEDTLYGSDAKNPSIPTLLEVIQLFEDASIVKITDNGDGTWTAEGPDSAVYMNDATSFTINWPSAVYIDAVTYRISSL